MEKKANAQNEMDVEAGNRLIADFMGKKTTFQEGKWWANDGIGNLTAIPYHTLWDWLRPAIEKAHGLTTEEDREFKGLVLFELGLFSTIKEVWDALIQFITWYNSNK